MKLFPTRNDLSANTRKTAIEILNARLAEAIDLALLTKQAHWNIKGPRFIALHEMLDGFRAEVDVHVDVIAERAVQLGGVALGTSQVVSADSSLPAYPTNISASKDHLAALIERYGDAASKARKSIDETSDAGDADSADILTGYSRTLDKSLWFLEAHIQEKD